MPINDRLGGWESMTEGWVEMPDELLALPVNDDTLVQVKTGRIPDGEMDWIEAGSSELDWMNPARTWHPFQITHFRVTKADHEAGECYR